MKMSLVFPHIPKSNIHGNYQIKAESDAYQLNNVVMLPVAVGDHGPTHDVLHPSLFPGQSALLLQCDAHSSEFFVHFLKPALTVTSGLYIAATQPAQAARPPSCTAWVPSAALQG